MYDTKAMNSPSGSDLVRFENSRLINCNDLDIQKAKQSFLNPINERSFLTRKSPSLSRISEAPGHRRQNSMCSEQAQAVKIQARRMKIDLLKRACQTFVRNTQVYNFSLNSKVKPFEKVPNNLRQLIDDQSSGYVNDAIDLKQQDDYHLAHDHIERNYRLMRTEYKFSPLNLSFHLQILLDQLKTRHNQQKSLLRQILMSTIKPTNPALLFWNFFKMLIILHTVFSFPMQDSFGDIFADLEAYYLTEVIKIEFGFLIMDILLNFNIETYSNGDQITEKKQIAVQYFSNDFIKDSLSILGFLFNRYQLINYEVQSNHSLFLSMSKYLFFLKLKQFNRFLNILSSEVDHRGRYTSYIKLIKLFFQIMMLAHLIACVWIKISRVSYTYYHKGWLNSRNIESQSEWLLIYAQAMYFATMTMTTVGYGDILPENTIEYFVCILIMLVSCGFFAYSLNTITQILSDLNKSKVEYKRQTELITNYMSKKSIDKQLQKRIINYVKSMYKSGLNDQITQEQGAIQQLSMRLKDELNFCDKGKMIMQIELFNKLFSLNLIKLLSQKVEEQNYSPQEIIPMIAGNIMFVFSGEIDIVFEKKIHNRVISKHLVTLQQGEYFGLQSLFGVSADCLIKSRNFTIIYTINKNDLMETLTHRSIIQEDYEKFCMVRDQVLLGNDTSALFLKCKACSQKNHEFFQCSQLFFTPNRLYVIQKHNYNHNNDRVSHFRRALRTKCLINSDRLKELVQVFNKSSSETDEETSSSKTKRSEKYDLIQINEVEEQMQNGEIQSRGFYRVDSENSNQNSNRSWLVPNTADQDVPLKVKQQTVLLKQPKMTVITPSIFKHRQSRQVTDNLKLNFLRRTSLHWKYFEYNPQQTYNGEEQLQRASSIKPRKKSKTLSSPDKIKSRQNVENKQLVKVHSKQDSNLKAFSQKDIPESCTTIEVISDCYLSFDLDCVKIWQHYNIQNNVQEVIRNYNKMSGRNRKNQKKNRRSRLMKNSNRVVVKVD